MKAASYNKTYLFILILSVIAALPAVAQVDEVPPNGSVLFTEADLIIPEMLIDRLVTGTDPVSVFVWSQFVSTSQVILSDDTSSLPDQTASLIDELNALLQGDSIYDEQRFVEVLLSAPTTDLMAQGPQGDDLIHLNRLLLEEAYPLELVQNPLLPPVPSGPAVTTDQSDYAPGSTARIQGFNFQAGETVSLQVLHADGTPDTGEDHQSWTVIAENDGTFTSTWHVCEDDCVGSTLQLAATGTSSGIVATSTFTDSHVLYERIKSFGFVDFAGSNPHGKVIQGTDGALYGTTKAGGDGGTVFKVNLDGTGFIVLKSFSRVSDGPRQATPIAGLVEGIDGALYGTTAIGGSAGRGTVFKLNPDGTGYAVLKVFTGSNGSEPWGALIQGNDGALYGTTLTGGGSGSGTVFKLNPDGSNFTVLKSLGGTSGRNPQGGVIQGTDGALYGTAIRDGSSGKGTVFKLNTDGSGFSVLKNFSGLDGKNPRAGLMQGSDGALYGTAAGGTAAGIIFKLNLDGSGFTVLKNLSGSDGNDPRAGLMLGSDGALYGTATGGGSGGRGTVFKLNPDGTGFVVLKPFSGPGGASPNGALIQASDGRLYGPTVAGGFGNWGTVFKINPNGSGFAVILNFHGPWGGDGKSPYSDLLAAADGALYGTTLGGGSDPNNAGTVYKHNLDGTGYTILKSLEITDGKSPKAGLVQGVDGLLYGTTYSHGPASGDAGTVFKLNPDGTGYTILKVFSGNSGEKNLVMGSDGVLYGTTLRGGSDNLGTVFKMNSDGSDYAVLKSFSGIDGALPYTSMMFGADGALYGTTFQGGSGSSGTVFKLNPDGTGFAVLKSFSGSDGKWPFAGLEQGTDGTLYGVTAYGGSSNMGTVFRLNPDGTNFVVLKSFSGSDGRQPSGRLIQWSDGALYGTSSGGGSSNKGTIFKLNADGTGFTVIHSFTGADGQDPRAGLMQGSDGALYGTTLSGGDLNLGTIFRLVDVTPNSPPVADAGTDQVVDCLSPPGAMVPLDGNGSSDPDDVGDIVSYEWSEGSIVLGSGVTLITPLGLGVHVITLTVTDAAGESDTDTIQVTVQDTTPPVITLIGASMLTLECVADGYIELGALAIDDCASSTAPTVVNFWEDNFNDGILDETFWTITETEDFIVEETGGVVKISGPSTLPDGRGVVESKFQLTGDFDVWIDYDWINYDGDQTGRAIFSMVSIDDGKQVYINNHRWGLSGSREFILHRYDPLINTNTQWGHAAGTSVPLTGKLRIQRVGTVFSAYYWSSGNWVLLGQTDHFAGVVSPKFQDTNAGSNPGSLEVNWDNFHAEADQIIFPNIPDTDPNVLVVIGGDTVDASTPGVYVVTYDATDASGNAATQLSRTVTVQDTTAPVIALSGAATLSLECAIDVYTELGASVTDACDPTVTVVIGGDTVDASTPGTYVVTYDATDASGNVSNQLTRTVTVQDTTPPLITILAPASGHVEAVGNPIPFAADIEEACELQDAVWEIRDFDDQVTVFSATISGTTGSVHEVDDSISFNAAGIYSITLVATDASGNESEVSVVTDENNEELPAFVVIYDPDGGFVTGGGWIWSLEGAFHPELMEFADVTGKATFGFVAKYKNGANTPTGNTEFQFKAGDLNFKSTTYQWLVVAGKRAQYKGLGTINGEGDFQFMLTGIDGDSPGGDGNDRLRMKIWANDVIIYDNQSGDMDDSDLADATIIQKGQVVIHKK